MACTEDAKICPAIDGKEETYVGRNPENNCEWHPCPKPDTDVKESQLGQPGEPKSDSNEIDAPTDVAFLEKATAKMELATSPWYMLFMLVLFLIGWIGIMSEILLDFDFVTIFF